MSESEHDKLEVDQDDITHLPQLSKFFEVVSEFRKNSEKNQNEKIEELTRQSAEQRDEIHRLRGLLIEKKVEKTFGEQSEVPSGGSKADLEQTQQGKWKRRLSSDSEAEPTESNEGGKERFLTRIRKIQLGRKRPKTMSKDSDQILKQKEKEIMSLKSSFKRSQKDAEEVISESKRRINKLEQENHKLSQTIDEKLSHTRFNDILTILNSLKSELGTRQKLPEAANMENAELNNENMKENSDSNMVDMDEDETEACQMAVRDLQYSVDQRDKLETENVRLLAQLCEKEDEVGQQREKMRELEEKVQSCSEELNEFKNKLEHQEKIILCKSQEIKAKNEEIQGITFHANLTKSEIFNLTETVTLNETQISTQKDDNDTLRKTVGQLEEKCKKLQLLEHSLKEENQTLCKYFEKLKKHVDQCNIQSEKYLKESEKYRKETKTVKELVKNRFNVRIFSQHGNITLE